MTLAVPIEDFTLHSLGLLQRILVTTDGTVTEALAAAFLEPVELVKLAVTVVPAREPFPALELERGSSLMQRRIVLRGKNSGTSYAYAEVSIAADRLPSSFREELLEGRVPLGQLWISHRLETFKERPCARQRVAGPLARHLGIHAEDILIERTYRTFTSGHPVFLVTEFFPATYRQPLSIVDTPSKGANVDPTP
jgi:chorismate-pyruvate lyase